MNDNIVKLLIVSLSNTQLITFFNLSKMVKKVYKFGQRVEYIH